MRIIACFSAPLSRKRDNSRHLGSYGKGSKCDLRLAQKEFSVKKRQGPAIALALGGVFSDCGTNEVFELIGERSHCAKFAYLHGSAGALHEFFHLSFREAVGIAEYEFCIESDSVVGDASYQPDSHNSHGNSFFPE